MSENWRLGFLASGGGSSIEELVDKMRSGELRGYEEGVIVTNKAPGTAGVYERAERLGVRIARATSDGEMRRHFLDADVQLILGLGFLKKVGSDVLSTYRNRVLNIHPTLLPKHGGPGMYGIHTHMAVLEAGDMHTGPTVHLMNEQYDEGGILRQVVVPVPPRLVGQPSEENAKKLQQFVLQEEYQLMPEVLRRIRDGRINLGWNVD